MDESPESRREGGCRCGAVRFATRGEPRFVAHCHCADCRKATGAGFATWVGWTNGQIEWIGEARRLHASSPGVERGFCPACGAPLSYQGEGWPGETHLTIGAFDDPAGFTPKGEVFTDEALPWARPRLARPDAP